MGNIGWNFRGKTVVITGASGGIGRETALRFARAGASLAICDLDPAGGLETAQQCLQAGAAHASFYHMDVGCDASVVKAGENILNDFGCVDILFSNAGIFPRYMGPPLNSIPDLEWERVFSINTLGMVRVCRTFAPAMKERRQGKIVLTSSISMNMPNPATMPYSASKIATANFAQAFSLEMGPYNVNVNVVCPGYVFTGIYANGTGMRFKERRSNAFSDCSDDRSVMNKMASTSALGRPQGAEDIANAVMFLCSDEASEITGQIINVDSGMIRRY